MFRVTRGSPGRGDDSPKATQDPQQGRTSAAFPWHEEGLRAAQGEGRRAPAASRQLPPAWPSRHRPGHGHPQSPSPSFMTSSLGWAPAQHPPPGINTPGSTQGPLSSCLPRGLPRTVPTSLQLTHCSGSCKWALKSPRNTLAAQLQVPSGWPAESSLWVGKSSLPTLPTNGEQGMSHPCTTLPRPQGKKNLHILISGAQDYHLPWEKVHL